MMKKLKIDKDKLINHATGWTVSLVALCAATVSYTHLFGLSVLNCAGGVSAILLPLSIDGLILASSLVLLFAARQKIDVPWLARLTLWLGIGATIAGNVFYGLRWSCLALTATIAAWPALAFVLTVETVAQMAKAKRRLRRAAFTSAAASEAKPVTTAEPKDGLPTYREIRAEFGCGQPVAKDIREIVMARHVDMHTAKKIRDERMNLYGHYTGR